MMNWLQAPIELKQSYSGKKWNLWNKRIAFPSPGDITNARSHFKRSIGVMNPGYVLKITEIGREFSLLHSSECRCRDGLE